MIASTCPLLGCAHCLPPHNEYTVFGTECKGRLALTFWELVWEIVLLGIAIGIETLFTGFLWFWIGGLVEDARAKKKAALAKSLNAGIGEDFFDELDARLEEWNRVLERLDAITDKLAPEEDDDESV